MEQIRARVDDIVSDPATAEALKPYYRHSASARASTTSTCETFNRDNVTLVDTDGQGVERITAQRRRGRRSVEYEVDCIIYASGFEVGTDYSASPGWRSTVATG